ncbi:hypothetical protein WDU94_007583 [Cyamophila willieti]
MLVATSGGITRVERFNKLIMILQSDEALSNAVIPTKIVKQFNCTTKKQYIYITFLHIFFLHIIENLSNTRM